MKEKKKKKKEKEKKNKERRRRLIVPPMVSPAETRGLKRIRNQKRFHISPRIFNSINLLPRKKVLGQETMKIKRERNDRKEKEGRKCHRTGNCCLMILIFDCVFLSKK